MSSIPQTYNNEGDMEEILLEGDQETIYVPPPNFEQQPAQNEQIVIITNDVANYTNPGLPLNVQTMVNNIFCSDKHIALIEGCRDDIIPLTEQQSNINNEFMKQKRRMRGYCFGSIGSFILSIIVFITNITYSHDAGMGFFSIFCVIFSIILGLYSYVLYKLTIKDLWNQQREITLFKFDVNQNNINYIKYEYTYGIYPDLKEITISRTHFERICSIDGLKRITKKNKSDKKPAMITFNYKNDFGEFKQWIYRFEFNKRKIGTRGLKRKNNYLKTYKQIKQCLSECKPGWKNPGFIKFVYKKKNNKL